MYLPPILRFLQFSLSTPDPVVINGRSEAQHEHLAVLSPYHDAPNVPGVSVNLPDDCTVDQVILVSVLRHNEPGLRVTLVPSQATPTRIPRSRI